MSECIIFPSFTITNPHHNGDCVVPRASTPPPGHRTNTWWIVKLKQPFKCFQMLSNAFKCIQMLSNAFKGVQMLQIASECFRSLQNASKCFQMLPDASRCFRMLQNENAPECFPCFYQTKVWGFEVGLWFGFFLFKTPLPLFPPNKGLGVWGRFVWGFFI